MEKQTQRKEAELQLIAEPTFGATIAAEAKLAKLAKRESSGLLLRAPVRAAPRQSST